MKKRIYTIGEAGAALGVAAWKIKQLIKAGTLDEPQKLGAYRCYLAEELPALRRDLLAAGVVLLDAVGDDAGAT
jgi:DNA-binding transcriptional MerR regulator